MNYSKRIDQAYHQIGAVKNKQARRDLLVILRGAEAAYTKMDAESVNCRRLKKQTPRYQELVKNLEEILNHLETHITFAALLN
jgi:hypothetical protein